MIKRIVTLLVISLYLLLNTSSVSANKEVEPGHDCEPGNICCNSITKPCVDDGSYACLLDKTIPDPITGDPVNHYSCQPSSFGKTFGKIKPPDPIKGLISNDGTGTGGINQFLSNLVKLFYSVAAVVLIFMLLWGAFEWLTSGGDKEKIASARQRIISAIIGLILFAVTFAIIQVLGQFTGFSFFVGQKP